MAIDGWAHAGACYTTAQGAVDSFVRNFDVSDSTGMAWITAQPAAPNPAIGTAFTYTFTVNTKAWTATTPTVRTGTKVFQPCDSGVKMDMHDSLAMIWIGLAVLVYGVGLLCGLNR